MVDPIIRKLLFGPAKRLKLKWTGRGVNRSSAITPSRGFTVEVRLEWRDHRVRPRGFYCWVVYLDGIAVDSVYEGHPFAREAARLKAEEYAYIHDDCPELMKIEKK